MCNEEDEYYAHVINIINIMNKHMILKGIQVKMSSFIAQQNIKRLHSSITKMISFV